MVENSGGLPICPENGPEREHPRVAIFMLQGMLDPSKGEGLITKFMAARLKAKPFNSDWYSKESYDKKLERLDSEVESEIAMGKIIVFAGISAGVGLGADYMSRYRGKVRHLFGFNGVLDPNIPLNENLGKLKSLRDASPSFRAMTDRLTELFHPKEAKGELNQKLIDSLGLASKISTYSSDANADKTDADKTVPLAVSEPEWVKRKHRVGSIDHAPAIAKAIFFDIQNQLKLLKKAKFD